MNEWMNSNIQNTLLTKTVLNTIFICESMMNFFLCYRYIHKVIQNEITFFLLDWQTIPTDSQCHQNNVYLLLRFVRLELLFQPANTIKAPSQYIAIFNFWFIHPLRSLFKLYFPLNNSSISIMLILLNQMRKKN